MLNIAPEIEMYLCMNCAHAEKNSSSNRLFLEFFSEIPLARFLCVCCFGVTLLLGRLFGIRSVLRMQLQTISILLTRTLARSLARLLQMLYLHLCGCWQIWYT